MAMFSSSYRSGTTRFLTRIRGVSPSLNRILQTVSTRHTLMRLMSSATFGSSDHSRIFWSSARFRSTDSPGLAVLTGLAGVLTCPAGVPGGVAVVLNGLLNGLPGMLTWPAGAMLDLARGRGGGHHQESDNQRQMGLCPTGPGTKPKRHKKRCRETIFVHLVLLAFLIFPVTHILHLIPFGGAPRRQNTSGSMVSA